MNQLSPHYLSAKHRSTVSRTLAASAVAMALVACGDSDNPAAPPLAEFVVANNVAGEPGTLDVFSPTLRNPAQQIESGSNEGVAFDAVGNLYQAGDNDSFTGLRVFNNLAARADGSSYTDGVDRQIDGGGDGLTGAGFAGKGIAVIDSLGRVVVADNAAGDIKIFSTTAGDGAAPLATVATAASPWDVAYNADSDRLYAALTNGTLEIFDDFSVDTSATADRTLTPANADDEPLSVNLHGVALDGNRVVVTDVGDATVADDGQIFVLNDDGMVNGNVQPLRRIAGGATGLGNPVDVQLVGSTAVVAEKANDTVLSFDGILRGGVVNLAPDFQRGQTKPESLVQLVRSRNLAPVGTDIENSSATVIAVAINPPPPGGLTGGTGDTGQIRLLETDLSAEIGTLDTSAGGMLGTPPRQLENIITDALGDAYVVFDNGSTGPGNTGVLAINRLGTRAGTSADTPSTDRIIAGADTAMQAPKGVDVAQGLGVYLIADTGNATIKGYSATADGNTSPLFTVNDVGEASVWDLDYDDANDRLYVAGTGGDVLVYDEFFGRASSDDGATVSRTITPAIGGSKVSVNLHGIIFVAGSNQLILSDVGDAASAEDGQVFVINNASSANGLVNVAAQIGGDQTQLGNPVDVAYDGNAVYVAEKSNDLVLRYDNLLGRSGANNIAADASIAVNKPESVTPVR